ncbi:MAG: phosphorylase [Eubacterium sp.]|nr:phosphorylase [Eubacterium sp.]
MTYETILDGMKRFGSTERDICVSGLGVEPEQVNENVIIAPWWEPKSLHGLGKVKYLSASDFSAIKVWDITAGKTKITYIKTGIGAPVLIDALLSLGVTRCKKIIFIGSVGSLDAEIGIGDIVIPEYSVCGDGASRYIASDDLKSDDCWGEKVYPNTDFSNTVKSITQAVCDENGVKWHIGKNYSIDTVIAQFAHIDEIIDMGCNVIEMETAAAFRAAKIMDIPIAAVFSVSDNTVTKKSLISGRTKEDNDYRRKVKKKLIPKIILKAFEG